LTDQEHRPNSLHAIGIEVATIGCALAALGLLLSWGLYLPVGAYYGGTAIEALVGPASISLFSTDWIIVFAAALGIILSCGIAVASRVRAPRRWAVLALTLCSATTLLILLLLPAAPYVDHLLAFANFNAPGYLLAVLGMLTCVCAAPMALRRDPTMGHYGGASSADAPDLDRLRLIKLIGSITAVIGAYLYLSQYEKVILGPRNPPSQTMRAEWLGTYGPDYRIAYGLWLLFGLAAWAAVPVSLIWRGVRPLIIHGAIAVAGGVAILVVLLSSQAPSDLIPTILGLQFESVGLFGLLAALLADALLVRALQQEGRNNGEPQAGKIVA
jgi:hypothetical protein